MVVNARKAMKKQICWLFLIIAIVACKKDIGNNDRIPLSQNPNWTTIPFKRYYTIQFPGNYVGDGMLGYEGNFFFKGRNDATVDFKYNYCSSTYCLDFGDSIDNFPKPNSIDISFNNEVVVLDRKARFFDDSGSGLAILYYNNKANAHGKLYWKDENKFKAALDINYDFSRHQEVLDIIKTIKAK
jgi:hypothetical protein